LLLQYGRGYDVSDYWHSVITLHTQQKLLRTKCAITIPLGKQLTEVSS